MSGQNLRETRIEDSNNLHAQYMVIVIVWYD